jgi:hypothetical protein
MLVAVFLFRKIMSYKKREELFSKLEEIRIDMEKYLNEYLLQLLKNKDLTEYELEILFQPFDEDAPELVKVHSVNDKGELLLTFEYFDGTIQNEEVEMEQLRFDALFQLIELLEQLVE